MSTTELVYWQDLYKQVMTSVSLPSTLVKCLYLFFDLPEMTDPDNSQTDSEFTPRERRILLQKIFVQVFTFSKSTLWSVDDCDGAVYSDHSTQHMLSIFSNSSDDILYRVAHT